MQSSAVVFVGSRSRCGGVCGLKCGRGAAAHINKYIVARPALAVDTTNLPLTRSPAVRTRTGRLLSRTEDEHCHQFRACATTHHPTASAKVSVQRYPRQNGVRRSGHHAEYGVPGHHEDTAHNLLRILAACIFKVCTLAERRNGRWQTLASIMVKVRQGGKMPHVLL